MVSAGEGDGHELPGPVTVTVEQPVTPPTGVVPVVEPYQSLQTDEVSRRTTGLAAARKLNKLATPCGIGEHELASKQSWPRRPTGRGWSA